MQMRTRISQRVAVPPAAVFALAASASIGMLPARGAAWQAQVRIQVQPAGGPVLELSSSDADRNTFAPANDRDAAGWLKRAEDAAKRGDWKLAADTLERVIAQHGDRTVSIDEAHYYSAIHFAQKQIAKWPPEGLEAYRVLYDPTAARLLERAKQNYDFDALREVARKYPYTTPGPEAIDLLTSWLLDRRQPHEAIVLLQTLSRLPHRRIKPADLLEKRAVAYALAHHRRQAADMLNQMRALAARSEAAVPADWPHRIEAVQRFLEHPKPGEDAKAGTVFLTSWPNRLGPAWTMGRMPSVDPVFAKDSDWTSPLPGAERLDRRAVRRVMKRQARPPVWQAVSDGERLFVTCPSGLVARDLATFDFLWQAFPRYRRRDPAVTRHRMLVGFGAAGRANTQAEQLDPLSTLTLYAEDRGEVSTAMGLVFVIEQDASSPPSPTAQGILPANITIDEADLAEPNTLRAYEAETGRVAWTKGRGGPPEDALRPAHFYAAPVVSGAFLIAPFLHREDLFLAVLKPDGTLVRRVLLGSGRAGLFPLRGVLQPTVHDGTIYVPTGAGLLLALDAYDFSLRWLTKYERASTGRTQGRRRRGVWIPRQMRLRVADEWLSSPPLVAGNVVLLAPQDADRLYAFDIDDGSLKWSYPRGGHRYIVGSDGRRVVIAGEGVLALDVTAPGQALWKADHLQPTGRPALSGDRVLVPTTGGLVRLDLATGEAIGEPMPTDLDLGNLLALDGSLYSIGIQHLSKFPDPVRSRQLAEARLEKNPGDVDAIIRLAWLARLSGHWGQALDLLDRAEEALADNPPSTMITGVFQPGRSEPVLRSRIAHQRTEALLNLAGEADPDERRDLLERAAAAASQTLDRFKAGLALSEYLAEHDQPRAGFERAIALLSETANEPVRVDERLTTRASVLIGERVRQYWQAMSARDRTAAGEHLAERIARATDEADEESLNTLADCLGFIEAGARLDLQLGIENLEEGNQESAIFHFLRAARREASAEITVEALLRLAWVYRFPGPGLPGAPAEAAEILDRLLASFADTVLPDAIRAMRELRPGATVRDFVANLRQMLPPSLSEDVPAIPRILGEAFALRLLYEDPVPAEMPNDGYSFWDPTRRHDVYANVVALEVSDQVRGFRSQRDEVERHFWSTDLLRAGSRLSSAAAFPLGDVRPAAVAGRVALLCAPGQAIAVGLDSGRAMWPPMETDYELNEVADPPFVQVDGVFIGAVDPETLVAIEAREGARPLWRRRWIRGRPGRLRAVGHDLIVVDRDATTVSVLIPTSGRERKVYPLLPGEAAGGRGSDDVEAEATDAHVAIVGHVVCRSDRKRVLGRDVRSGRTLWTVEDIGLVKGLCELDADHLGISHGPNQFAVVRVETGEVIRRITAEGLVMPPLDAVIDSPTTAGRLAGARLLIFARTDDQRPEYVLKSIPLDEGESSWLRELGPFATISRQMMRASPNYLAVVRNYVPDEQRKPRGRAVPAVDPGVPPKLEIVRKDNGRRIGPGRRGLRPYDFDEGSLGGPQPGSQRRPLHVSRFIRDVIILDDRIIAVAPEGIFVLADEREVERSDETAGHS